MHALGWWAVGIAMIGIVSRNQLARLMVFAASFVLILLATPVRPWTMWVMLVIGYGVMYAASARMHRLRHQ